MDDALNKQKNLKIDVIKKYWKNGESKNVKD